jgi:O-methyltransferase involved in polyketide biosynthesis
MPGGVHDSALIVNCFRARYASISGDRYAALWTTDEVEQWADQYIAETNPTESLVHALRHRFFLEQLAFFFAQSSERVLINIGAGFTNYPYLLPAHVSYCEIDSEININFKRHTVAELEARGDLPQRRITFLSVHDLNNGAELKNLETYLKTWIDGRASFILLEGVFFYLTLDAISHLYAMFASLQRKGDIVASTSFRPEEANKPIYQKLVDYCRRSYAMPEFTPTTLPTRFYAERLSYALTTHTHYYALAKQFAAAAALDRPDEVLEEDCYLLEHQG